uniref:Spermatosis associated 1 n=1 Tax=Capra hircus TaxID=9925 RepID=A0A452DQF6_CAPHI
HVFYVPEGSWNYKLNTISIEVVNEFISAGFIRVSPHLTLQDLREHLSEFLGEEAVAEKFLFLKCIGNNLTVVKTKQESELKLKSFVPPYALQPELYLLPIMDHLGNIYSASAAVSLDEQQTNNGVAEPDGIIHRPLSITPSKEEPGTDPSFLENALKELLDKNQEEGDFNWNEVVIVHFNNLTDFHVCLQLGKTEYIPIPDLIDFPSLPCQPALSPGITDIPLSQIEREKIIEQMKQVEEERRYLERIREELIKKAERLLEQGKLKCYHACGVWKKRCFETKKVTASLEEVLTKLREDLELYYKKLLMQLEVREIKMRPKNLANITDSKNYLIIQITEVQHAIDQLKRKLDTDKMKLIIEIKMRKQAISDLRTLKAELAQKKLNTTFQSQLGMLI